MRLEGKKVLVVGLGVSGLAAARLCAAQGARVTATDQGNPPAAGDLRSLGVTLRLCGHKEEDFQDAQLIVLSPGVDHRLPEIRRAQNNGAKVIGEMELGWRFLKAPAVMVTGTNGKSTVVTLIARMLEAQGLKVFLGGNLGTPLCDYVAGPQEADWAVLEVSSFQTDTALTVKPRVGVILNITPDHLDRYTTFDDYAESKFRLVGRQTGEDVAILCADDPVVWAHTRLAPARVWAYGAKGPYAPGGWLEGDSLVLALDRLEGRDTRRTLDASACPLVGTFNRLNLLAASLAALAAGASYEAVQAAMNEFRPLAHRLALVAEADGVIYVDDSKGTNVGAAAAALESLDRPVVMLLGGRDKEGRFRQLASLLEAKARATICFGEAGPDIARQLGGRVACNVVPDLPTAVGLAKEAARPGDAVLLSPGCASFDAYTGYAARGDHFQSLVKEAIGG